MHDALQMRMLLNVCQKARCLMPWNASKTCREKRSGCDKPKPCEETMQMCSAMLPVLWTEFSRQWGAPDVCANLVRFMFYRFRPLAFHRTNSIIPESDSITNLCKHVIGRYMMMKPIDTMRFKQKWMISTTWTPLPLWCHAPSPSVRNRSE